MHVNAQNESTPVDVRVYQLKIAEPFINAAFEDLWLDDSKALAGSQVGETRVVTIYPAVEDASPQRLDAGRLLSDTNYIGIMALFRRAGNPDQRRLLLTRKQARSRPEIHFHGFAVSLQAPNEHPVDEE
ncbi:MAG: type VI secretion system lipoprotein TssJ [Planctomycetota bacterium]|nr:MAG: type VI secretion system lipoprotein TssJ [Planctomycetota bacterium]